MCAWQTIVLQKDKKKRKKQNGYLIVTISFKISSSRNHFIFQRQRMDYHWPTGSLLCIESAVWTCQSYFFSPQGNNYEESNIKKLSTSKQQKTETLARQNVKYKYTRIE